MNRTLILGIILITLPFGMKYFVNYYYGIKPGVRGVVLPPRKTTQPVGIVFPTSKPTTRIGVRIKNLNLPSIKVSTTRPATNPHE